MIKLIVADMDGTLLDSQRRLPENFPQVIAQLKAQGIRFAIASGRQYANLLETFGALADDLVFIAENGSIAYHHGQNLYSDLTPLSFFQPFLNAIAPHRGTLFPVLCGPTCAMICDQEPTFEQHLAYYFAAIKRYTSFDTLPPETPLCKVAIFAQDAGKQAMPYLAPLQTEELRTIHSSTTWVDIMPARINKGRALTALFDRLQIQPSETLVFGDYLNDLEMMQTGAISIAMANAHPTLLKTADHITASNDDQGVLQYLCTHDILRP